MKPGHFVIIAVLMLAYMNGCGVGTRYVFNSSTPDSVTPADEGIEFEDAWFYSRDGVLLHGWFVPNSRDNPLILFFHGNAANISHRTKNIRYFHDLGFPLFVFDYRGFGKSQGHSLREEDLHEDANAALDYLRTKGWAPEAMIYFGRSMGATPALKLALEHPPAGLVLESPLTSLRDLALYSTPLTYILLGWWAIDLPLNNLERISSLKSPLLVVHGLRDKIVPPEMSRRLFDRAPLPKDLVLIPGAGHSNAFEAGDAKYRRAWLDFAVALP